MNSTSDTAKPEIGQKAPLTLQMPPVETPPSPVSKVRQEELVKAIVFAIWIGAMIVLRL